LPEAGLLLSETVASREGERLTGIARAAGVALRCYTPPQAKAHPERIHAAFFSRELYEGSTLHTPGPLSNAFFEAVDAAPALRWLHVCSSGLDLPQYAAALGRGVRVTSSAGVTAVPIAQTALAAILGLSRGFGRWLPAQAASRWDPFPQADKPGDLSGQRVLVVGAGSIGLELGRLLKAVGFRTTAVRRGTAATPHYDETLDFSGLDAALPHCDWLVLAVPLTQQTRGFMDARRLALLPRHARFANIARGELVDEAALTSLLQAGRLAGAYLDVFAQEPLPAHSPLWSLPNVWISPHNSSASRGHEQRVIEIFVREFESWVSIS
jgi:phosphoglycerate dehydrogenase-like enzyme